MRTIALSFGLLWGVTCLYALLRGGAPERITATLFVAGALGTPLVDSHGRDLYLGIEWGVLGIDAAMLGIILPLALVTTRFWPMLMASLQLAQVATHLAAWLAPGTLPAGYYAVEVWWSYPMLVLLLVATRRHRRRRSGDGDACLWRRLLGDEQSAGPPPSRQSGGG